MNSPVLLDTNVIIYYFRASDDNGLKARDTIFKLRLSDLRISIITQIEFLTKCSSSDEMLFDAMFSRDSVLPLSEKISDLLPSICLQGTRKIKLPDALIAATCIVHDIPIITFDTDFLSIPGVPFHPLSPVGNP